jgi:hypothetical protein
LSGYVRVEFQHPEKVGVDIASGDPAHATDERHVRVGPLAFRHFLIAHGVMDEASASADGVALEEAI